MAWLKANELAAQYGVSSSTVRAWVKDGMPSARGPGNVTVIDPEAAEEWLDALEDDEEEEDDQDEEDEGENEPEDEDEDEDEDEEDGLEDGDEDGEDEDDEDREDE